MLLQYIGGVAVRVKSRPPWAEALRRRREELGLTQERLAELTALDGPEPLVSQTMISALETGSSLPTKLQAERLFALLRALRWTPEEFAEATGLDVPLVYRPSGEPREDVVWVPVVGSGVAGRPWPESGSMPVPRPLVRPGSVLIQVEGDSMDTGEEDGLRDGDLVLVDQNLKDLREGRVYAVEIIGDGITIKRARKLGNRWILISDNPKGPLLEPEEVRVIGEVYRKISIREVK
ncbi:XRE family transcriptional regulator [Thermus neutrinimicus]|uniref:XRE family transcriptional regulator n=1 Tax=Thermus neutrinimicus TaxID=2908149 RepID=UPI001FA97BFA|nr:S24 family peptidase [Thermus neutrinimicus]